MRHDVYTELTPIRALTNTLNAALVSATVNGDIIDFQGEFGGAFLVNVDAITGGTLTIALQVGDAANLSDAAAVTDPNLVLGPVATALTTAGLRKFQYQGIKRYGRLTFTGNAGITGAIVNAIYASRKSLIGGF